ncbi:hypothetical protein [Streptomyces sp. DH12]|uniref:hypothetical protein n=1 Tax=Streptomyces sp. DH12 TaxID=2857010 RepID=UPI001E362C72|nr:hypothetical protein [Streptomyces sp. DH12]
MDFVSPQVAAAGIRAAGGVTAAWIGQYRPVGVPRTGSAEDRAAAYRRLLDASARVWQTGYLLHQAAAQARPWWVPTLNAPPVLVDFRHAMDASGELIAALYQVRLCGTVAVIAAAEELVTMLTDLADTGHQVPFDDRNAQLVARHRTYLDACRDDLSYTTRRWHVRRRWAERRFRRAQAERAQREAGGSPAAAPSHSA